MEQTVYQGQFGEFTITDRDRNEVRLYRGGLVIAAVSFTVGCALLFGRGATTEVLQSLTVLYGLFVAGLAVSLTTIHIYLKPLHRLLQIFLAVGAIASIILAARSPIPLALFVYNHPLSLFGVGFTFAALTGIFFKEGFCFHRLETRILTPLVPILLLGHLVGALPLAWEQGLLAIWSGLFLVFAFRKIIQPIPPDIGDKSVFEYLKQQRQEAA
ncbi:MAG: DUF2301 domain-containing membrane protein [Jaaginema sp. PMC 1079.18]|nr:DUF2301 domain-containing membrane protein [Jaaginema sp. PMC 1080.18]MEC4853181.1 DUF2301 domain-containing membrane protein [Jaaginema sp. PMC 1079.18]MEC4868956.1 DUF2301 domain-containing membrane protein [Jaaginema sp. PMC 1078.18]